jgi:hypothetical protein
MFQTCLLLDKRFLLQLEQVNLNLAFGVIRMERVIRSTERLIVSSITTVTTAAAAVSVATIYAFLFLAWRTARVALVSVWKA